MAAVTGAGKDALASETAELCPNSESQTSPSCVSAIGLPDHSSEACQESSIDSTSSKTKVIHVNFMLSPAAQLESPSGQNRPSEPGVENLSYASTVQLQSQAGTVQVSKASVISKLLQTPPVSFVSTSPSQPTTEHTIATNSVTSVQVAPNLPSSGKVTSSSTAEGNLTGTTVYIIEEIGSLPNEEPSASAVEIAPPKDLLKCDECDYSTHNKHYLKQHVDLVHSDERPYRCPFCDYAGKRSHSLKEHLVVHSNERPFQCSKCNATFRKKGHLTNHIKMHTPPATPLLVECPVCGERVQERTGLYAHLRNCHSSENVYVCDVCDFATTSNTNIILHLHSHNKKERFRCKLCDFATNEETSLAKHSESHALPKPPIVLMKCTECGFTTKDNDFLKKHMWQHINKPEVTPPPNFSFCPTNAKEVTSQEKVTGDTGETTYRCGECYHETKEAYKFIAHMLTHKSVSRQTVPSEARRDVPLVSTQATPGPSALSEDPKTLPSMGENVGFTHDKSMGRFRCNICHYTCDYQRTIKAHVWKHSGHKDIDYPMFQNGPLSIYDDTPIVADDGDASKKASNPAVEGKQNLAAAPGRLESKCREGGVEELPVPRAVAPSLMKLLSSKAFEEVKCIKTAELHNSNKNNNSSTIGGVKAGVEVSANPIPSPGDTASCAKSDGVEISSIPIPVSMYVKTLLNQNPVKRLHAIPAEKPSTSDDRIENPVSSLCPSSSSQSTSFTVVHSEIGKGLSKQTTLQRPVHLGGDSGYEVDMIRAAKRLCTEERKLGLNVVVETIQNVPAASTFTGLRSQQGSPRGPEMTSLNDVNFANDISCHLPNMSSDERKLMSASGSERQPNARETPVQVHADTTNPLLVVPVSDVQKMSPDIKDKMWSEEEIARLIASGAAIKKVGCDLFDRTPKMREHSDKITSTALGNQDSTDQPSVHEEQALTLLSLLKKGPHHDPEHCLLKDSSSEGCPEVQQEILFSDTVIGLQEEQVMSVDEESQTTEENSKETLNEEEEEDSESKPKAGICSSLLAVIEQLRERSKSESETDDGLLQPLSGGKRKARRRNRKNSSEDGTPIENMDNVEKLEDCEIKYRCKLCHYTNVSILLMKQHMRLHKTKKPFECSLCDFVAESSETLQDHMIQHCKVRTYQCKICPSAFNYKSQLRAHMRAHNEKDPFLCDSCDFETTNPITFRNHTRMHSDRKVYKCENCGDLCSTKSDLKIHQRDVCGMLLQVFVCDECTFETSDKDELKEHEKSHSKKQFRCSQCDYVSFSFANMRVHARVHEEVKEMKCDLCNFIAASSRSLKSHMKRHINDQRYVQQPLEQYKCNLCGYVCHHLPSLKSHMWRHASDKNYIYEFTNEVINAAIDFDSRPEDEGVEIRSPTPYEDETVEIKMEEEEDGGQEPCLVTFRCCQCGFETISKSNLNKHMKMHADIIQKTLDVTKTLPHQKGRPLQVE